MTFLHVLLFGRDLRVHDNAALQSALAALRAAEAEAGASGGHLVPVFAADPAEWRQSGRSARQWAFASECLDALDAALKARGSHLVVRTGHPVEVLGRLHSAWGIASLHGHDSAGAHGPLEAARHEAVAEWAIEAGIPARWHSRPRGDALPAWLREKRIFPPAALPGHLIESDALPAPAELGLEDDPCPGRQRGGRSEAVGLLRGFAAGRGRRYSRGLGQALDAERSSSRLSPHLAWGSLGLREAWQAAQTARQKAQAARDTVFTASLDAFINRLDRRSFAAEALARQPRMETESLHGGLDRHREADPVRLAALASAQTGYPLIDAAICQLTAEGWLPEALRQLVAAFATHQLALPWQSVGDLLARLSTDHDPAAHALALQAAAGTTQSMPATLPNPVTQSRALDGEGGYLRRWLPALARLPAEHIHAPWLAPAGALAEAGVRLGEDYPLPLADLESATRRAREALREARALKSRGEGWTGGRPIDRAPRAPLRPVRMPGGGPARRRGGPASGKGKGKAVTVPPGAKSQAQSQSPPQLALPLLDGGADRPLDSAPSRAS